MDIDSKKAAAASAEDAANLIVSRGLLLPAGMDVDTKEPAAAGTKEAAKPEASTHMLDNPARVTPGQEQYIAFSADQRWQPLSDDPPRSGILMCVDTRPGVLSVSCQHVLVRTPSQLCFTGFISNQHYQASWELDVSFLSHSCHLCVQLHCQVQAASNASMKGLECCVCILCVCLLSLLKRLNSCACIYIYTTLLGKHGPILTCSCC